MQQEEENHILSGFRKFDLFRKASRDITHGSSSGAVVSVIAAIVIFILIATEIPSLFQMEIQSQLFIDKAETQEKVQVNINLVLHNLPCMIASLSMKDALGNYQLYDQQNTVQIEELETALKQKQGCRLEGYFFVNKVPGFFQVSVAAFHGILALMRQRSIEMKIDLTHTLFQLTFGGNEDVKTVQKFIYLMFGRNLININQKQALDQLRQQKNEEGFHFSYYLNIVPAQFKLPNHKDYNIFQYTINSNLIHVDDYSAIFFRYEFAGVSVQYSKQAKIQFFQFLVSLCAIIGGIFSIAGLTDAWISNIVGKMQDWIKGSREIENSLSEASK